MALAIAIATGLIAQQRVLADTITMNLVDNNLQVTLNATKSLPFIHADNQTITIGNASAAAASAAAGKSTIQPINIYTGSAANTNTNGGNSKGQNHAQTQQQQQQQQPNLGTASQDQLRNSLNATGTLKTCIANNWVGPCYDTARHEMRL